MAPEDSKPKRKAKENQYIFDLGVKGRKTGLVLPELGERDEHGLEPMDHLFSSPEKSTSKNLAGKQNDATLSDEEDMEMASIPGPIEVLAERQRLNARFPPPRSRSPVKTHLNSPARRNAAMGAVSSPVRGSIVETKPASRPASVQRKLEFSTTTNSESRRIKTATSISSFKQNLHTGGYRSTKLTNGRNVNSASTAEEFSDEGELDDIFFVNGDNSHHMEIQPRNQDEAPNDESEKAPHYEYQRMRANGKAKEATSFMPPRAKEWRKKLGEVRLSPAKGTELEAEKAHSELKGFHKAVQELAPSKQKASLSRKTDSDEESEDDERPYKRSRISSGEASSEKSDAGKSNAQATKSKGRNKKKTKENQEANSSLAQPSSSLAKSRDRQKGQRTKTKDVKSAPVQPGPRLPKSRGLVILRRQTSKDDDKILRTRYGRNSIRPLAFWSNEKVEFEDEEIPTKDLTADFAGRKIKHVVRAEEIPGPTNRSRTKAHSSKLKKRKRTQVSISGDDDDDDDDDDIEPWEADPGRIVAEVRSWNHEDPSGSQFDEREEEIALSSAAIITRDIANASFRFAKTLTLPFFGAGMVDLPPGSEKKQKNSRKMQMAFFVFYGKVQVTVNDNVFRISKGGMWQVPRGNFYGIQNDYDKPARIFFSQGCEIEEEVTEV